MNLKTFIDLLLKMDYKAKSSSTVFLCNSEATCLRLDHEIEVRGLGRCMELGENAEPLASSTPTHNKPADSSTHNYVIPSKRRLLASPDVIPVQRQGRCDGVSQDSQIVHSPVFSVASHESQVAKSPAFIQDRHAPVGEASAIPSNSASRSNVQSPLEQPVIGPQFTPDQLQQLLQNNAADSEPEVINSRRVVNADNDAPAAKKVPTYKEYKHSHRQGQSEPVSKGKDDEKKPSRRAGRGRVLGAWAQANNASIGNSTKRTQVQVDHFDGSTTATPVIRQNVAQSAWERMFNDGGSTISPSSILYSSPGVNCSYIKDSDTPPSSWSRKRPGLESVTWDWKARFRMNYFNWTTPFIDTHCHLDFLFGRSGHEGTYKAYRERHADTFAPNYHACVAVFCNPRSWHFQHGRHLY